MRMLRELAAPAPRWRRRTDVVVVGTGAGGLAATLRLAKAGLATEVVTRAGVTDTATAWAQGGLAAVWSASDSPGQHVADTLEAGAGLCDPAAVWQLVLGAPDAVRRLIGLGASFDRDASGRLDLHLEGGHRTRRILHAHGDGSGAEVERALAEALAGATAASGVWVSTRTRLVDLLTDASGACCGVRVLDADGWLGEIEAAAVVLASGGVGQAWSTTTNPPVATGDGLAAAWRAGAAVRDVEFVQFHPTLLVVPDGFRRVGDRGVLVSEAVRGEGARLLDAGRRPVMAGVHPLGDLAPRDVVSAALEARMAATGASHCLLDATGFGKERWQRQFPGILALCRERGVDPVREPIPVRPGAHYHCGGVAADLDGRTSLPGLFAVGEVAATGVQGANRLASNSITEALVAGDRAGALLVGDRFALEAGRPARRASGSCLAAGVVADVRAAMDAGASVYRTEEGLTDVLAALARAEASRGPLGHAALDATNLHTVATLVATAALRRTESRGCHRRADHPEPSSDWLGRLTWRLGDDGPQRDWEPLSTHLPADLREDAA
jgi:L-aspartate oxidase